MESTQCTPISTIFWFAGTKLYEDIKNAGTKSWTVRVLILLLFLLVVAGISLLGFIAYEYYENYQEARRANSVKASRKGSHSKKHKPA